MFEIQVYMFTPPAWMVTVNGNCSQNVIRTVCHWYLSFKGSKTVKNTIIEDHIKLYQLIYEL